MNSLSYRNIPMVSMASLLVSALLCGNAVQAQQDMETSVPTNWAASTGALSISNNHYKMGAQSLRWDWTGGDVITVSSPGIVAANVTNYYMNTCDLWLWNGTALPGQKLRVEFMNGTTAQYWFDFYLDYTGWRHAVRSYTNDMAKKTSPSSTFTSVRISAPATGGGSFYFDAVNWVGNRFTRVRDAQNVDITGYFSDVTEHAALANVPDIGATTPTSAELSDLATIRSRWLAAAKGATAPSAASVSSANASFTAKNIAEDANGIRGTVAVAAAMSPWEGWSLTLARDYAFGTATAATSGNEMLQLGRHLADQGLAYDSNEVPWSGAPAYSFRDLPTALVLMAPAYDSPTKARLWDLLRWNYVLGNFWSTGWLRNTDDVYTGVFQSLGAILFLTPDDTTAVQMLKGFQRHMEEFVTPSDGGDGGIKVDGTGSHHGAHYNAYMYAFPVLSSSLYYLRGTGFQVDAITYQRLSGAFLAMMCMSADGTSTGTDVGYFSNALSGRDTFSTNLPFSRNDLRILGEWGGNISGQSADSVIAQAYNRRFGVNDYALFTPYGVEPSPDGFYQFNYSPLGVYRRSNWVASIRGTQKYFWSSEIYATQNRYGRYQSYGALELLYYGGVTNSGEQLAGWDWNHVPGATTIVLPDSKLISEGEEAVRSQLNFAGALSFYDGQSGLYACNFQEANAGVNHNPSFVWRKSWFCFDNQIICLGSNIADNDATNSTATTLFQGHLATQATAITIDGSAVSAFPFTYTASGSGHWLLDSFGTGYYVQPGPGLKVTRSTQSSANQAGSGSPTTGDFSTAWLDHGTAPAGASYEYAVFPATNATSMASTATQYGNSVTKPYQVIEQDSTAHVVQRKADGRTGYAIYATTALPIATQTAGLLTSVTRPCLMMMQLGSGDAWVTVVDPDLNFANSTSTATDTSLARTLDFTVNGVWNLDTPPAGTSILSTTGTSTTLRVTTQSGSPVDLHLVP